MKNTQEGINNKLEDAQEWVSHLEEMVIEGTNKTRIKNENMLRHLWDNIKCIKHCIIRAQKDKKEKGTDNFFKEVIAQNSLHLWK